MMKVLNTILVLCVLLLMVIGLTYDKASTSPLYEQSVVYLESQNLPELIPNIQKVIYHYYPFTKKTLLNEPLEIK